MNNNLNFEAVKGYHLNLRKLNDDQTKFITENLIKYSRDFEGNNNLFHYGYSTPNNEYRFFNFNCFSLGQISEEISFDEYMDKLNFPKPEYDPKDVAFNQNNDWAKGEEMETVFETKCGQKITQNKKLIGYKLVKEEYEKQALEIASENCLTKEWNTKKNIDFHVGTNFYNNLLKSGILDLWFEPVFEKESITLKSGVKLSEDDIAEVKEILNNK